ncbi:MAG: hypothetical protein P8O16_10460 [Algoriphagus sp.]|uniref:c-type cytochrome domain-containing protein n=1 Tax=Algoriphagus sp. TaxID=1872435 RepID=UPI0026219C18|nr:c-type cytochrome domain-containing protein [Algoriphagus sp.]MDG1277694.1 hypothetical protein [Algoriphagus sp.]
MDFLLPLFGRFHPLFVHLPIGILFFAVLLIFLSKKKKNNFSQVIPIAFLTGTVFAFLSAISGFFQYQHEGYTWETVRIHLILGWCTVALSAWLYFSFRSKPDVTKIRKIQSGGLLLILILTGHFGGNITHGDDYLFEVLPSGLQTFLGIEIEQSKPLELPTENWEELAFYEGAIQPILNHNCISCHNPKNMKGELDLTSSEGLLGGGEGGKIVNQGNAENSKLFSRLILPKEDEEHMPPKEKRQPRKAEIELIKAWIENGGSMDQTLGDSKVSTSLISQFFAKEKIPFYPKTTLQGISSDTLSKLREKGFFIENIALDNPLLRVSCINFPAFEDKDWELLNSVSEHIAYLDLSDSKASASILDSLGSSSNITVLKVNGLEITGENLFSLKNCQNLKLLYLNSTDVTMESLSLLDGHPTLEKVYVFKTPASSQEKKNFSFELETGDYLLPKLATDTIVY